MFVANLFVKFSEEPKPFAEDILRRVEVTMSTFGADPLTNAEVLDGRVLEAARGARL